MPADHLLVEELRRRLKESADPARAPGMQAYMKSELPFYGVPAPVARRVFGTVLAAHPLPDRVTWQDTVLALWREVTHREEWYAALALAGHRRYREHQNPATLELYSELVVTGAWWDVVDDLASHKVGDILRAEPEHVSPIVLGWATDEDLWLRRTAILSQLGSRERTDRELLHACLEPNFADREFFIRKAIGWSLRQLAWTDADWVRAYVTEHADRLSPLSRREALKNIGAR